MDDTLKKSCKHGADYESKCYPCHLEYIENNKPKTEWDTLHETLSQLKVRIAKLEEYKRLQDDLNKESDTHHRIQSSRYFDLKDATEELFSHTSKLDEHRKKQIDENRAVEKHLTQLDEDNSELNERQNDLNEDITALKDWMSELERMQAVHIERSLEMQKSLSNLENMSDFKQLEACILAGAQTHLTVLKMEARLKELEAAFKESQAYVPFDEADYDEEVEPPVILNMVDSNGADVRFVGNITIPKETLCMDKFTTPPLTGCYPFPETPKTTGLTFEEAITLLKEGKNIKVKGSNNYLHVIMDHNYFSRSEILSNEWEIVE